jgi:hypothetical protein
MTQPHLSSPPSRRSHWILRAAEKSDHSIPIDFGCSFELARCGNDMNDRLNMV